MTSQAVMKRYLTAVSKTEEYANNKTIQNLATAIANFKKLDKEQQAEINVLIEGAYNKLQAKGFSVKKTPTRTTTTRKTRTTSQGGLKAILAELKKKLGSEKFKEATTGTDIEKDIKIPALKKGKRIVRKKGYTTNEYGTFKNQVGTAYWESRANRFDANQPSQTRKYKLADGGQISEKDIEDKAMFYTDESRWSTKPTISKFKQDVVENEELLRKLKNKETTPSKIIGRGYKPSSAKKIAENYLNEKIMVAKKAIEILESKGEKFAKGGDVERGSAHIYITKTNGEYKVYHGSDVTLRKNAKPLYISKDNPEGTWDKIWSTLRGSKMADGGNTSQLTEAEREQAEREIREAWEGKNIDDYVMYSDKYGKGGKIGKKVFEAKEDGILGIFSGSDSYSIQISKGDTFVTYGDQDDSNWWYVKKIDKKPSAMSLNNNFDYTKSKSRVKVNWDDLILTFPKGDNMIYAKMVEIHAKGGTTKRIKRRGC
jgi:hypothetical protein